MEESRMSYSSTLRTTIAAAVLLTGIGFASTAQAESCAIAFTVVKAGFVVGGQGGSGAMRCAGRTYPISIGGLSYGFMIGASETRFRGTATFNGSPRRVAGVYGAGGAGAAIGRGAQAIVLANQNGAVLALTGYQRGLQINADLSGLVVSMR
jgi:lipid-binding SYLF domain-containing protein